MGKAPVTQSVIELIEPGLLAKGLELVDVEFKKEGKNWVLRIFIDKEGYEFARGIGFIDFENKVILDWLANHL